MFEFLMDHQQGIRLSIFAVVLLFFMLMENIFPRRAKTLPKGNHYLNNLLLSVFNSVLVRIIFPLGVFSFTLIIEDNHWGLFYQLDLPHWLEIVLAITLLDLLIYGQHILFHKVPFLWRLHRVHHADIDLDVSSGVRFHPVEIVLSLLIKMLAVFILGVSPVTVLIFEIILNATAMFNHGNFRLPLKADVFIRKVFVTPDMHRIHHSIIRKETDSNYGFNVSWWDRLFRTYTENPQDGQLGMTLGINAFRQQNEQQVQQLLLQPFRKID